MAVGRGVWMEMESRSEKGIKHKRERDGKEVRRIKEKEDKKRGKLRRTLRERESG